MSFLLRLSLFALGVFAGLSACSEQAPIDAPEAPPVVGFFGAILVPPFSIELDSRGSYTCDVCSGAITRDGCGGPFAGDGESRGSWSLVDGRIVFDPVTEAADLRISLEGAYAAVQTGGLSVTAEGQTYFLPRRLDSDGEAGE